MEYWNDGMAPFGQIDAGGEKRDVVGAVREPPLLTPSFFLEGIPGIYLVPRLYLYCEMASLN